MDKYNTSYVDINYDRYCLFCGEKIKKQTEHYDHYDEYDYYPCACSGAVKEQELLAMIAQAKQDLLALRNEAENNNQFAQERKNLEDKITALNNDKILKHKTYFLDE